MKKNKQEHDHLLLEIERELCPGRFIRYTEMSAFTQDLHRVEEKLEALVSTGEADRAVGLYETFLAGCYEKIEESDDSGADLSMFWDWLFRGWIKARQAAGLPASETVRQILKWKENDDYGFCYHIEKEVVQVLDADGYKLFVAHFEKAVDDGLSVLQNPKPSFIHDYDNGIRLPAMSLKDIYETSGDVTSYAALCERLGLSPKDCECLAEMERKKRHWKQALAWIEKGLALEPTRNWRNESSFSLKRMKPEILSRLGRKDAALEQSWADFEKQPSEYAYEDFMRYVPKGDKAEWHERAMALAATGDLESFLDLCVKTKEWKRLAERIHSAEHAQLEAVSFYYMEGAAERLAKQDILAAAKLYRAMGFQILNAKKSKYYDNALEHFESARELYMKAGKESEWSAIIDAVRANHSRKIGFMPSFEKIVSGGSAAEPSFSDRLKARWAKQMGDDV